MRLPRRALLSLASAGLAVTVLGGVFASEESHARAVVLAYFDALASGDTLAIASNLADPLLESRKQLLTVNPEYPDYLRDRYRDALMSIAGTMDIDRDTQFVDAFVFFPEEAKPLKIRFTLVRKISGWKIASEETPIE